MTIDSQLEHLYQQIRLVRGAGDPKRGQLCVMSFVAFLTGEAHSDNPSTASGLIRHFAMVVNDEMPDELRQRLKTFAPRLIGTNDGEDPERMRLLAEAARREVLPRIVLDFGLRDAAAGTEAGKAGRGFWRKGGCGPNLALQERVDRIAGLAARETMWVCDNLASELAILLSYCGRTADKDHRDWYWFKAIDLLDRMCDVTSGLPRPALQPGRLSLIEACLDLQAVPPPRVGTAATLARIWKLVPTFMH